MNKINTINRIHLRQRIVYYNFDYYSAHIIVISYKSNVFFPFNSLEIAHLTLNNNHLRLSKL
jgi:hypothetical protein